MTLRISELPKVRSEALRQSARGQPCSLRIPTVCIHQHDTTVLAHLPGFGGMSTKGSDIHGAFACFACHNVIDRRTKTTLGGAIILDAGLRGLAETQARWVHMGLITGKDWDIR